MPDESLFGDDFFKKLKLLKFMVRRLFGSGSEGEKISRQRGGNIEFKDYRKYTPGDEPRYIDWNLFGRTERWYVKEFAKEDTLPLYILLDQTASMSAQGGSASGRQPSSTRGLVQAIARLTQATTSKEILRAKFIRARQMAAALGYVGMITGYPSRVIGFSWDKEGAHFNLSPVFHRENEIMSLVKYLEGMSTEGQTNLGGVLRQAQEVIRKKGLVILISDLFDSSYISADQSAAPDNSDDDPRRSLLRFRAQGFEVCVMHILAQAEETPPFRGWVRLKDVETNESQLAFASERILKEYRMLLNQFAEDWRSFCLKHNIKYFYVNDTIPFEKIIFDFLRRGGLLK